MKVEIVGGRDNIENQPLQILDTSAQVRAQAIVVRDQ